MLRITSVLLVLTAPSIALASNDNQSTIETIVVTASAGKGMRLLEAPASVSIVNIQEESKFQFNTDIGDLIADVPGVSISTQANGSRGVRIRGLSNDYTQVLLNGQRSYTREALWRGSDNALSQTPSVAIDNIEVIRGPMSTLYGADTMGGVVNVITRKHSGSPEGALSIEGQYNEGDAGGNGQIFGLYYSTPINDVFSYTVYSNYLDVAESFYLHDPGSTKRRKQVNYNFVNTFDLTLNNTNLIQLDVQLSNEDQSGTAMYRGRSFEQERKMQRYNVKYEHLGVYTDIEANLHYSDFNVKYDVTSSDIREENYDADIKAVMPIGQNNLSIGAESRKGQISNIGIVGGSASRTSSAAYIEADVEVSSDTKLTFGARYDHDSLFKGEFTYRGYLNHTLSDKWSIKAGFGTAFKAPTMAQISDSYTAPASGPQCPPKPQACYVYGNPDLKAETGTFSELGAYYNVANSNANITAFYNRIDDIMQQAYRPNSSDGYFAYVNIDKVTLRGLEFYVDHQFESVGFDMAYTYLDAKDGTTGERLVGTSEHEVSAKINWFTTNSTDMFARLHYRSEVRAELGQNELADAYTTLDLGIRYLHSDDIDIKLGVNNITNEDISSPKTYSEVIQGRTFYAGLNYQF